MTLKPWLRTFARIAALWLSLFALSEAANAESLATWYGRLQNAKSTSQKRQLLEAMQTDQHRLPARFKNIARTKDPQEIDNAVAFVGLMSVGESKPVLGDVRQDVEAIKASVLYKDSGRQDSNWLGRAFSRLRNLHLNFNRPKSNMPSLGLLGTWLTVVMWVVLGILVLFLLVMAIKHFSVQASRKRKSRAILDEGDPDRTLDEWLEEARRLEGQQRFREAVRCLYLACLLKFDEARIAKFDRGQTNWEHLRRIESSRRLPLRLDFRSPTQSFDRIWYGHQVEGQADVDQFMAWYLQIKQQVEATDKA